MPVGNKWTLAELNSIVDNFMNDTTDTRWTSAQKDTAIRMALLDAPPRWWEIRIDDTNTYDEDDYRYDLPPACEWVEEVWFEPLSTDKPRYLVSPTSWHVEEDELVFTDRYSKYDGQTIYIVYGVYPTNLLTLSKTDGVVASTTATALTSAGSTFITSGVRVGDAVVINETSYDGNGTYYVESVDSETQLTLHKAPGTAGSSLDFTVAYYTDLPVTYIRLYAAAELYEVIARNSPGLEIDEVLRLAQYYREKAEEELRKKSRAHRARRSF
jgi:hypothetical protein